MDLIIHERKSRKNNILAIFIHGLGNSDTWEENGWVSAALADNSLETADIGVITYDSAHLASWLLRYSGTINMLGHTLKIDESKFMSIEDLAHELKREIGMVTPDPYNQVILIGHSMGGLIALRYILSQTEHKQKTFVSTYISLATPFNGATLATIIDQVKIIQNNQVKDLRPNCEFLDETTRKFINMFNNNELRGIDFTFCFAQADQVVEPTSAVPFNEQSIWMGLPLPGDHNTILGENGKYNPKTYQLVGHRIKRRLPQSIKANNAAVSCLALHKQKGWGLTPTELAGTTSAVTELQERLAKLPNDIRFFFYEVVNRAQYGGLFRGYHTPAYEMMKVIECDIHEIKQIADVLGRYGLASLEVDEDENFVDIEVKKDSYGWNVCIDIRDFCNATGRSLRQVLVELDFALLD